MHFDCYVQITIALIISPLPWLVKVFFRCHRLEAQVARAIWGWMPVKLQLAASCLKVSRSRNKIVIPKLLPKNKRTNLFFYYPEQYVVTYSSVPNRPVCRIINLGVKIPPMYMSLFGPTGLLILRKFSHLHIYSYMIIYFGEIPPCIHNSLLQED